MPTSHKSVQDNPNSIDVKSRNARSYIDMAVSQQQQPTRNLNKRGSTVSMPKESRNSVRSGKNPVLFAASPQALTVSTIKTQNDKFKQLMQKDWNVEFAQVHQNLGKLD